MEFFFCIEFRIGGDGIMMKDVGLYIVVDEIYGYLQSFQFIRVERYSYFS